MQISFVELSFGVKVETVGSIESASVNSISAEGRYSRKRIYYDDVPSNELASSMKRTSTEEKMSIAGVAHSLGNAAPSMRLFRY